MGAHYDKRGQLLQFPSPLTEGGKENDVERINAHEIYGVGQELQKLRKAGDWDAQDVFFDVYAARNAVAGLLQGKPVPLGISQGKVQELLTALDSIIADAFYVKDDEGKAVFKYPTKGEKIINSFQWSYISGTLDKFETVFAEEMRDTATYYVPRRGIFNTKALVDAADESFPATLLAFIPEKTREDWKAAGRCLAFNLLSASGFHVARAVEGTVESYYQIFCGKAVGTTLHSWGEYIKELDQIQKSGSVISPSEKTIAELQQMKDDYRNPIAHPRIVLSEADARMLFSNGESLIIGMAQEICVANSKAQPSLSLVGALTSI